MSKIKYLNDIGIPAYVPPKGITHKRIRYNAHIYTDEELQNFFDAVDKSQSVPDSCPYRADVMPVFSIFLWPRHLDNSHTFEINLPEVFVLFLPEQFLLPDSMEGTFQRLPLISLFGAVLPTDTRDNGTYSDRSLWQFLPIAPLFF